MTFIDVAGNEKYAKTMIRGICSHYPDYAVIFVDSSVGITSITKDHVLFASSFNIPVIVVLTKSEKIE